MKVFLMPSCWERFSISSNLNSVPLSECNILGKPNFNMMSENKWFATVVVFMSLIGVFMS